MSFNTWSYKNSELIQIILVLKSSFSFFLTLSFIKERSLWVANKTGKVWFCLCFGSHSFWFVKIAWRPLKEVKLKWCYVNKLNTSFHIHRLKLFPIIQEMFISLIIHIYCFASFKSPYVIFSFFSSSSLQFQWLVWIPVGNLLHLCDFAIIKIKIFTTFDNIVWVFSPSAVEYVLLAVNLVFVFDFLRSFDKFWLS